MKDLIPFNTRVIDRDGVAVHQRRPVFAYVKTVWYKPWSCRIEYEVDDWYDVDVVKYPTYRVGDRVQVKSGTFSAGSMGEIKYIEPVSGTLWVLRDGATNDIQYQPQEVDLIWRRPL
jgi:transcription antitermination factor NusG